MNDLLERFIPRDGFVGTLVGRAWLPGRGGLPAGPALVAFRADGVFDLSRHAPTMAALIAAPDPVALARGGGERIGDLGALLENSFASRPDPARPTLLAPVDLQCIKAAGVTFAASLIERVIEERTKGDPARADAVRRELAERIGIDLGAVKPGSAEAEKAKALLQREGLWSQYLEVGIGPDAEVFTKAPPMSAVGTGTAIGIRRDSSWNNPEPEIVLAVDPAGAIKGAALGNDVNLRDFEGRSALLLGKSKDNNASCAIGPFIRLLDATFTLDDLRRAEVRLTVEGTDDFRLEAVSDLGRISRDVTDLVAQTIGKHHQYPDGFVLFTGTMFAPTQDRAGPGSGFTHKVGDIVTIASPKLGALVNRVDYCDAIAPWTFGLGALMKNLAARGLL
ncbi:MAG TPA: fumarylacetoacetate hydrolase family protein [Alphaproteobacteria bacterium]|jgi:fumarylacetoacetate (FAA) hydrolase family protein